MATTNNAVVLTAGLRNTALTSPAIGSDTVTTNQAFTDGHNAADSYVALSSSAAALHSALTLSAGQYGWVLVNNPGPLDVEILIDGSPDVSLGSIPTGQFVFPVGNGVVLNGKLASSTQTVGVTVVKAVTNV